MSLQPKHLKALFAKARNVRSVDPTFDDDAFKDLVQTRYGVASRKDLSMRDFRDLCNVLDALDRGGPAPAPPGRESEAGRRTPTSANSLHSQLDAQAFVNEHGLPWPGRLVTDADRDAAVALIDDFRMHRKGRRIARGVVLRIVFDAGADRTGKRRPWADFDIDVWREARRRWRSGGRVLNEHFFRGIMVHVERDACRDVA